MQQVFTGRLLMIGYGGVAKCVLPLLLKQISPSQITIIDALDKTNDLKDYLNQGVTFRQEHIMEDNMHAVLSSLVNGGDIIVDLSTYIDTYSILAWCRTHEVMYLNSSVEVWSVEALAGRPITDLTLYARHQKIQQLMATWGDNKGSTAVLDHGANPGLVSHFAKVGLIDIAEHLLKNKSTLVNTKELELHLTNKNFPKLAELTGTKVIHISERDTQIINKPKKPNEFVNTWSIEGFIEEGLAPAELGWGTHEKNDIPGLVFHETGPKNQVCFSQMGIDTLVHSWVPSGEIIGMVIRHGEAYTLSNYLTVIEQEKVRYRPSVYYAYCPADYALNSFHELKMHGYTPQKDFRLVGDEIIEGHDELGTLLMGNSYTAWWVGSILDIHTARQLVPGQNATTLQVAASILSAFLWIINNPRAGVNVPDELPYEDILKIAKPYLGALVSMPVDWTPKKAKYPKQYRFAEPERNYDDLWQFANFLVR